MVKIALDSPNQFEGQDHTECWKVDQRSYSAVHCNLLANSSDKGGPRAGSSKKVHDTENAVIALPSLSLPVTKHVI